MSIKRRTAKYVATLIYVDEPQLILLQAGTVRLLAVAIPSPEGSSRFLAVTVNADNWEKYSLGHCDLRYLYSIPTNKILYYFDIMQMSDCKIRMEVAGDIIPEEHLPLPRVFSAHHTSDYEEIVLPKYIEDLSIDGQWEMNEFGKFYQKYSDLYALVSSVKRWRAASASNATKNVIKKEFTDKPFKGGSSYLHLFEGLLEKTPISIRPSLREVSYASPGVVRLRGEKSTFDDLEGVVRNFIEHREEIRKKYTDLRGYLSREGLLSASGSSFSSGAPQERYIRAQARSLSDDLAVVEFDDIAQLTDRNALVEAKIVLAAYRRVEESSMFFAQGRLAY
jgi:hypothetical protein